MRPVLHGTTAIIALALAVPAFAQEAQSTASEDNGLGEIIVTAQRKEETLQKTALAIDAVSGADLAQRGISNAIDITKAVPAISFPVPNGNTSSIFVRGVGNITVASWTDPAVAPSYDGVVLGRGGGVFGAAFYDLARVEVLKGPQGILYGRNATGGAVNIIPARPEIGRTSAGFNLGYGNYDAVDVDAHVNLGVSDTSALRLGAAYSNRDGFNRDRWRRRLHLLPFGS
jgi:iron complex outermembrane receptor protein